MRIVARAPAIHIWLAAATVGATHACTVVDSPTRPVTDGRLSLTQAPRRTLAEEYRALASRAPGFAGAYFDSSGIFTINHASPEFDAGAQHEVLTWVTAYRGPLEESSRVRLRRVKHDYLTLHSWYQPFVRQLASVPSLTSARIDDYRTRIVITVASIQHAPLVRRVATELGIPSDAVDVEERSAVHRDVTLREHVRPVYGGLQIQSGPNTCSLAFNGYEGYQDPDPEARIHDGVPLRWRWIDMGTARHQSADWRDYPLRTDLLSP